MKMVQEFLGGLALFGFGMDLMTKNLRSAAGDRVKYVLTVMTKNPLAGVLAGIIASAILQSSGVVTVMLVGFVSARFMTLRQAVSVIMGANIGTTVTPQLTAFQMNDYIWAVVFIGFSIWFFSNRENGKTRGLILFGFGLLFVGINTMKEAMGPLAASPVFVSMMKNVAHIPVLGVLAGTFMAMMVQSSNTAIAVLQSLASRPAADEMSSVIGLSGAIAIMMGANIGTTFISLLAGIGQSVNARRTAVCHSFLNISCSALFLIILPRFTNFIVRISPKGPKVEIIARQIANAHTVFNLASTILWLPFIGVMVKAVKILVPDQSGS